MDKFFGFSNDEYSYDEQQQFDHINRDYRRERRCEQPIERPPRYERSRSRERYDNRYSDDTDEDVKHNGSNAFGMNIECHEYHHGLPPEAPGDSRACRPSERWRRDTPSHTIFLGGLPRYVGEDDIRSALEEGGFVYRDIRMVRHKDTGANRGFAFVEFHSVDDARQWMEHNQGYLRIRDSQAVLRTINMDYSRAAHPLSSEATPPPPPPPVVRPLLQRLPRPPEGREWPNDWLCSLCGCNNFRRRERCFKCNTSREESEAAKDEDGFNEIGTNPCNTLLFRGLDAMTTEEGIANSLSLVTDISIKNILVMKHPLTCVSRGYGFVELYTLRDSGMVLELISRLPYPFEVDGKAILVSYARNTFSTTMAYMSQNQQFQEYAEHVATEHRQSDRLDRSSSGDNQNSMDTAVQHHSTEQLQHPANGTGSHNDMLSAESGDSSSGVSPDVSSFVYDEASGYYYDSNTGYYYDATTQYFYNAQTSQFLYWDSDSHSYVPAPSPNESDNSDSKPSEENDKKRGSQSTVPPQSPHEDKAKKEKALQAKKIAKDMERWAKMQNAQKESLSSSVGGFKKPLGPVPVSAKGKESAAADVGFAVLAKGKSDKLSFEVMKGKDERRPTSKSGEDSKSKAKAAAASGPLGLVASYGNDTDSEEEPEEPPPPPPAREEWNQAAVEEKMTDWDKLTCLLCKRLFNSREILVRHQQISDLHKANLAELKRQASTKGR